MLLQGLQGLILVIGGKTIKKMEFYVGRVMGRVKWKTEDWQMKDCAV